MVCVFFCYLASAQRIDHATGQRYYTPGVSPISSMIDRGSAGPTRGRIFKGLGRRSGYDFLNSSEFFLGIWSRCGWAETQVTLQSSCESVTTLCDPSSGFQPCVKEIGMCEINPMEQSNTLITLPFDVLGHAF